MIYNNCGVTGWSFLTSHAQVLLCIAHDPGARLRHIAASTGVTERTAYGIVTDLTQAGYAVKHDEGRRNRCQIQDPAIFRDGIWPHWSDVACVTG
jgi:hypothetical protein